MEAQKKVIRHTGCPTEEQDQIRLATWLSMQGIKFFAIPNGGKRSYTEAVRLKRSGTSAGVPDLCIPTPRGGYGALFIELKRAKGGKLSAEQRNWLQYLREQKFYAEMANGFDEAREIVLHYLSLAES